MCPISSSPQLSFSLQVTGVSCNMLWFPTWVLMRPMNIHEEEADIAVWQLCRRCLCAQALWWPHFWGICCAVGRRQGTLAPLLMMQMCDPQCCFGRWLWMTPSQGPSSLPGGCWQSLSLASSCWWRTARERETEKRSYLSVRCLHSSSSASSSSLCFWLVANRCHGPPLWGSSPSFYHTFLYFLLRLFIFSFPASMRLLSWNILSCDVDGSLLYVLKDIWESHFSSKRLRDSCSSCLMRCCFLLCSLQPPRHTFSLSALFCSSDFLLAVPIVISHVLSPLFSTLLGSLSFAFSHWRHPSLPPLFLLS